MIKALKILGIVAFVLGVYTALAYVTIQFELSTEAEFFSRQQWETNE